LLQARARVNTFSTDYGYLITPDVFTFQQNINSRHEQTARCLSEHRVEAAEADVNEVISLLH